MTLPARAPTPRRAPERREKFTPVDRTSARSGIRPKLGWFLTTLEDLSMDRTPDLGARWGIVYDADLRPLFGSDDTIARLWAEAEAKGYLIRVRTPKGARIGFVWLRRLTGRPVATPETIDLVRAELEAAVAARKGRARTISIGSETPCTYRRIAGAPTAELRVHLPQNCGGSDAAPLKDRTRDGSQTETIKTTTTGPESSSSFDASNQRQGPERPADVEPLGPIPAQPIPADASIHVLAMDPAPVPELPAELVQAAAEVIPGSSPTWLRSLLAACGQHGLALALLVLAWVKARLEHPAESERPRNGCRYAITAAIGWREKLDARPALTSLDDIRAEIRASPRIRSPDAFDPAALLARMRAAGWTLRAKPDGTIERVECREGAPAWEGPSCAEIRTEARAHGDELIAYVLAQAGKGASRGDP